MHPILLINEVILHFFCCEPAERMRIITIQQGKIPG
jgi:hypothetical protein